MIIIRPAWWLIFCLSSVVFATPTINETERYYKIQGNTASELRKQMNDLGPFSNDKRYDAQTLWHVTWHYDWRYNSPSENPCYVTKIEVSADITRTMPAWDNTDSNNIALKTQWNNYLTHLILHEQGHGVNGIRAAEEIEDALLKTRPMRSCKLLQLKLDNTAQAIIKQHNVWDEHYDAETQHGKTQGATFP